MTNIEIGQTVLGHFKDRDGILLGTIVGITEYPEKTCTCVCIGWEGPDTAGVDNVYPLEILHPVEMIFQNTFGVFLPHSH